MSHVFVRAAGASFVPSGMLKAGTFTITGTALKVTGWTADPAYPGSAVVSDGLAVQGGKPDATVTALVTISSSAYNNTYLMTVRKPDGTILGSDTTTATGTPRPLTVTVTGVNLTETDRLEVWVVRNNFAGTVSEVGTYLRVT